MMDTYFYYDRSHIEEISKDSSEIARWARDERVERNYSESEISGFAKIIEIFRNRKSA